MNHQKAIGRQRQRRRFRIRGRVRGTAERPRLSVFRSHRNIYVQLIDDMVGRTLLAVGTADEALGGKLKYGGNQTAATAIGKAVAERALAAGIKQVAFDRRDYRYHGRVAALATAAREGGLDF